MSHSIIFLNGLLYCCNLCWEATLSLANDEASLIPLEKHGSKILQSSPRWHHLLSLFSLNLPMDNLCHIMCQCSFTEITLLSPQCLPLPIFAQNKHPYRALFCQRNKPLLLRLLLCHEHFIPSYQPSLHLLPVLIQLPGVWLYDWWEVHSRAPHRALPAPGDINTFLSLLQIFILTYQDLLLII